MVFVICFAAAAVLLYSLLSAKLGLDRLDYNSKKFSHNALIFIATGVCLGVSVYIFHTLFKAGSPYPFEKNLTGYNAYEQLFDALMKHQLNIDVEPARELTEMLNPYDSTARDEAGFYYLWDRAYYNGNYYCYFGIAPVLLVYFPFYFITKTVPSAHTVCFIMSAVTVPVIAALTVKAQKLFLKKVNLPLLLLSVMTVEFGSLVFTVQSSADMYYTAVQSGILFLALFLLTTLWAYEEKTAARKSVSFFLSAVSLVLLVLSRPNLALFGAMAVPIYLNVLFCKEFSLKQKAAQVLSFAVPLCIGGVFVMWYNFARFGSAFEFGSSYQLTVHDVREYSLSLSLLIPTFYYYFTKLPTFTGIFPFIDMDFVNIIKKTGYEGYVYVTSTVGAFSLPVNLMIAASGPMMLFQKNKVKSGFVLTGAVCVFAVAFTDMCLGGVNIRYLADIMLVLTLLSVTVLLDLYNESTDKSKLRLMLFVMFSLVLILSAAVGFFMIFENERNYILNLLTQGS